MGGSQGIVVQQACHGLGIMNFLFVYPLDGLFPGNDKVFNRFSRFPGGRTWDQVRGHVEVHPFVEDAW